MLIIIFQEYIEAKIKIIITDLTTQSALKKRVKNEKSTECDAISDAIYQKMESDQSVLMMGQDIADYGGVFKISKYSISWMRIKIAIYI